MRKFDTMTTGQIVACNYEHAAIFKRLDIDFCCNGNIPLPEACKHAGLDIQAVTGELEKHPDRAYFTTDFQSWPTDLLLDYILKFHHRRARSESALIIELTGKVTRAHVSSHPELRLLKQLVPEFMIDLTSHLEKEETVLFPYLYELSDSLTQGLRPRPFHCGSIRSPVAVMMAEHDGHGERFRQMRELTGGFTTPEDGCASYYLLMERLKLFEEGLHHHIHLENNILFPRAMEMEQSRQPIPA